MTRSNSDHSVVDNIIEAPLQQVLSEKYLSYALSTIMSRSLPDVRDGLKPVHRRLLYAMQQLNLKSESMPKKSARVVGDVIGKFHPHGDTAVYDTLVRLAQDFAVRYPLVYGQGNFGNVDGDNAAAMRYTESKLTKVAERLLEGLNENTVDFRATYDGDSEEPVVLPANFPNLLANGATGIAVGMATSIPPHNVSEICSALIHLIDTPQARTETLVGYIQGPDFPTGGILVEDKADIVAAYETGKGSFRVRARWHQEDLGQGQYQLVVTEIPYMVQKSSLIEKVADLLEARKLPLLDDIADESAEDIRIILRPKSRNVEPEVLMATLFRHTDFENKFSLNANVLDQGVVPKVMPLRDILQAYLDHRHEILVRRSQYRLGKIDDRLEVLEGYLITYLNIDEVIQIIREEDEPKQVLMSRFQLNERQAEAILNMRLRNLRKLEEFELRTERDKLQQERQELSELLANNERRWHVLKDEIKQLRKDFSQDTELGKRRTTIAEAPKLEDIPAEAEIEREPITILCSHKGWIKALKGHNVDTSSQKYKEGDKERFVLPCQTTDKLLILSSMGRMYTLDANKIQTGRGFGEPVKVLAGLADESEITAIHLYQPEQKFLVASDSGRGFVVPSEEVIASTRNGKAVLNVGDKEKAKICRLINNDDDTVAVIGKNRKLLLFPLDDLPEMSKGKGVILQKYKDGGLSDAKTFKLEDGLTWEAGRQGTRTETELTAWLGKRAQAGRMAPHGFSRNNQFSA